MKQVKKFLDGLALPVLNLFCKAIDVPKGTRKLEIVEKIYEHLERLLKRQDKDRYNNAVRAMYQAFRESLTLAKDTRKSTVFHKSKKVKMSPEQFRIPGYEQPEIAAEILRRSKEIK